MSSASWTLLANTTNAHFIATTTIAPANNQLLNRAIAKWLLRGEASELLSACWEYVDKENNDLEEALLDQLNTQSGAVLEDPQTSIVRTRDYAIEMTVSPICTNKTIKMFTINIVLFVYYPQLKKKVRVDEQDIHIVAYPQPQKVDTVIVTAPKKTPAIQKRSSKRMD